MENTGGPTQTLEKTHPHSETGWDAAPFRSSTSTAQGYHEPSSGRQGQAEVDKEFERIMKTEGMGPEQTGTRQDASATTFRNSSSEPQAIGQAEKTQDERRGVVWRFKNAFLKSENAIGTWMTLGFIKGWTDKTFGAWGRTSPLNNLGAPGTPLGNLKQHIPSVPGVSALSALAYGKDFDKSRLDFGTTHPPKTFFEKTMAIGATGALLQNLVFFATARGGEIPDGDTVGQRMLNSLKNPDKHAVHFSNVTMAGCIALIGMSRLGIGMQGLRKNPENTKKNISMLISGSAAFISVPLVLFGMFRIKKEDNAPDPKAQEAKDAEMMDKAGQVFSPDGKAEAKDEKSSVTGGLAASLKPGHLKEMWQYALKNDKMGLTGRALAVMMEAGFMVEGRARLAKDPTDTGAYSTVKGGLVGLALTLLQTHFVYDRLLTDSKKQPAVAR